MGGHMGTKSARQQILGGDLGNNFPKRGAVKGYGERGESWLIREIQKNRSWINQLDNSVAYCQLQDRKKKKYRYCTITTLVPVLY